MLPVEDLSRQGATRPLEVIYDNFLILRRNCRCSSPHEDSLAENDFCRTGGDAQTQEMPSTDTLRLSWMFLVRKQAVVLLWWLFSSSLSLSYVNVDGFFSFC
jgi:hypothetical protein